MGGEFNFWVRKQAGTKEDKLKLTVWPGDLALTGGAMSVYNTTLAKDFKQKLFLKPI